MMTRRALLRGIGFSLGTAGLGVVLAACGGEDRPEATPGRSAAVAPEAVSPTTSVTPQPSPASTATPKTAQAQGGTQRQPTARHPLDVVTPVDTTVAGAAGQINLPAEVIAVRQGRLLELSEAEQQLAETWRLSGWSTNFSLSLVPLADIRSGGVPRDGIQPIDEPKFVGFEEADKWVGGREPVIALELEGDARAYPLQILIYHEIVNDVVGGRPVAVTFCPLCNSSMVFDREVYGAILRFGVSGSLRNSDLIMWDSLTESWWQQLTGEGIVGDFAGVQLSFLPAQSMSYDEFKAAFPQGRVLSRETGFSKPYGRNPYPGYDSVEERPFLFDGRLDDRLPATARVVAISLGGEDVAYPFELLRSVRVVNDTVGGEPVVVLWTPETVSALDARSIEDSRAVGSGVAFGRLLEGRELTFEFVDGVFRDAQTGSTWTIAGQATAGELQGLRLPPVVHANHFWFAWAAFKPDTRVKTSI